MFKPYVNEKAIELVSATLRSGWIGEGPRVQEFEEALQKRFGFRYCVALNSGTSAIRLAMAMCDVGPGDEVLSVSQTCSAGNTPILEQFATPIFCDIQYETGNIDPSDIEHRITERTKAITFVHWAGYPADLNEIHEIAAKYDLPVIEDGAHALGATYKGHPIGNISDFTMFSLQAIKQLTTSDGGLLTMLSQTDYDAARRRRWFGIDRRNRVKRLDGYAYWNQAEVGYKYHMNDVAASIGLGNLEDIDEILGTRKVYADFYYDSLKNVSGVTLFERKPDRTSGHWLFTIHVENRDAFCRMMSSKGIEVSVCHIRNDSLAIFGPLRKDLPNTDRYEKTHISIPLHNHLSPEDIQKVIDAIEGGW